MLTYYATVGISSGDLACGPAVGDGTWSIGNNVVLQVGATHQDTGKGVAVHPGIHYTQVLDAGIGSQHAKETQVLRCIAVHIEVLHRVHAAIVGAAEVM